MPHGVVTPPPIERVCLVCACLSACLWMTSHLHTSWGCSTSVRLRQWGSHAALGTARKNTRCRQRTLGATSCRSHWVYWIFMTSCLHIMSLRIQRQENDDVCLKYSPGGNTGGGVCGQWLPCSWIRRETSSTFQEHGDPLSHWLSTEQNLLKPTCLQWYHYQNQYKRRTLGFCSRDKTAVSSSWNYSLQVSPMWTKLYDKITSYLLTDI